MSSSSRPRARHSLRRSKSRSENDPDPNPNPINGAVLNDGGAGGVMGAGEGGLKGAARDRDMEYDDTFDMEAEVGHNMSRPSAPQNGRRMGGREEAHPDWRIRLGVRIPEHEHAGPRGADDSDSMPSPRDNVHAGDHDGGGGGGGGGGKKYHQPLTPGQKVNRIYAPEHTHEFVDAFSRPAGAPSGQQRNLKKLFSLERASSLGAAAVRREARLQAAEGAAAMRYSKSAGVPGVATPKMGARLPSLPSLNGEEGTPANGSSTTPHRVVAGRAAENGGPHIPMLPLRHIASAPSAVHTSMPLLPASRGPPLDPLRKSTPAALASPGDASSSINAATGGLGSTPAMAIPGSMGMGASVPLGAPTVPLGVPGSMGMGSPANHSPIISSPLGLSASQSQESVGFGAALRRLFRDPPRLSFAPRAVLRWPHR